MVGSGRRGAINETEVVVMPRQGRPYHDELNNPTCGPRDHAVSEYEGRAAFRKRIRKFTNPELRAIAADVTDEAKRRAVAA